MLARATTANLGEMEKQSVTNLLAATQALITLFVPGWPCLDETNPVEICDNNGQYADSIGS
jgi:hypothetical protein